MRIAFAALLLVTLPWACANPQEPRPAQPPAAPRSMTDGNVLKLDGAEITGVASPVTFLDQGKPKLGFRADVAGEQEPQQLATFGAKVEKQNAGPRLQGRREPYEYYFNAAGELKVRRRQVPPGFPSDADPALYDNFDPHTPIGPDAPTTHDLRADQSEKQGWLVVTVDSKTSADPVKKRRIYKVDVRSLEEKLPLEFHWIGYTTPAAPIHDIDDLRATIDDQGGRWLYFVGRCAGPAGEERRSLQTADGIVAAPSMPQATTELPPSRHEFRVDEGRLIVKSRVAAAQERPLPLPGAELPDGTVPERTVVELRAATDLGDRTVLWLLTKDGSEPATGHLWSFATEDFDPWLARRTGAEER